MSNLELIEKLMQENNISGEIYSEDVNVVSVQIEWGDWKHDHLRLQYLVSEKLKSVKKHIIIPTKENGSDAYCAIHKIYFNEV